MFMLFNKILNCERRISMYHLCKYNFKQDSITLEGTYEPSIELRVHWLNPLLIRRR